MRSFRSALALRLGVPALGLAAVVATAATLLVRRHLLDTLDGTLHRLAAVEVALATGASSHRTSLLFQTDLSLPGEAEASLLAAHAAQLRAADGTPLARSRHLEADLPRPAMAIAAAASGGVGFETHAWNAGSARSVVYRVPSGDGAPPLLLQVAASLAPLRDSVHGFGALMAVVTLGCGALAFLVGWTVAGGALRPALALTDAVSRLDLLDPGRRVRLPTDVAEFRRMADSVNGLLDRVERTIRSTGRLTADASHALRAPLTVLRGELELALARARGPADYEAVLRRCLEEVLRLTRLADDLRTRSP